MFALFYAKCLTWMISLMNISKWIALLFLIFGGGWLSQINLPLLLDEGIAAIPFYYAGKIIYPYLNSNWNVLKWVGIVGMGFIMLMPMKWFPWVFVPYTGDLPLLYPVFCLMTICSFVTFLWIGKKLENQKWLVRYGTQTLGILVIHPLLLHTCAVIYNRTLLKGAPLWCFISIFTYVIVGIACYYISQWIRTNWPVLFGEGITSVKRNCKNRTICK